MYSNQDCPIKRTRDEQGGCDADLPGLNDGQPWIDVRSKRSKKTKGAPSRSSPG